MPPATLGRRRFLQAAAAGAVVGAAATVETAPALAAAPKAVHPRLAPELSLVTTPEWHLARRAAHAPTPAMAAKIKSMGRMAWVDWQLAHTKVDDSKCQAMLDKTMPWLKLSTRGLADASEERDWVGNVLMSHATSVRQTFSNRVLYESVVEAMGDHLYVNTSKSDRWIMDYDRTVIRKHALGRFSSMLTAALRHPAMLIFLDNDVNTKDSPNENLGRELLELHTVGEGAYTEADVRASAKLLTGHSSDWASRAYRYRPQNHHVGALKIMGFSTANATADGGPDVLAAYAKYLAKHKSTARRICRRLAVRFVSDEPSSALLDSLVKVYLDSDTRIAPVVRAIFASSEFASSVGKKWRRPQEWMAAMLAAGQATWTPKPEASQVDSPWKFFEQPSWLVGLAQHTPRGWRSVNGYPDSAKYWMSTTTLLSQWNAAEAVAGRWDRKEVVTRAWEDVFDIRLGMNVWDVVDRMTMRATGYTWRREDCEEIAAMICSDGKRIPADDYKISADDLRWRITEPVRLVLASPYFMMR